MAGLLGLAALVAPEAHVAPREATAWTWMLEVCASYLETGARAVFDNGPPDGEQVARPEGGLCNGDPACETAVMTFIGGGAAAGIVANFDYSAGIVCQF